MITKYTHTGIVVAAKDNKYCDRYKAKLRKIRKWWETKEGRRFDKDGFIKGHYENIKWKMEDPFKLLTNTIEKI